MDLSEEILRNGDVFLLESLQKESQLLATFRRIKKLQGSLRGKHFWGPKNRCDFSPASENRNCNRRKIARLGALGSCSCNES